MDYRRVVPRFQKLACLVQMGLAASGCVYVLFQIAQIVGHSNNPPVLTKHEPFDGAGVWAICASSGQIPDAGMGIQDYPNDDYRHYVFTGWSLSETKLKIDPSSDSEHSCAIVNLTQWRSKLRDWEFYLCTSAAQAEVYVWSDNSWRWVSTSTTNVIWWFMLEKFKYGHNSGWSSSTTDSFRFGFVKNWVDTNIRGGGECSNWTRLTSDTLPAAATGVRIGVNSAWVVSHVEQGIGVQIWELFSKVGGYVALMTLSFTTCFVKTYPESGVAQIYESRTFVGERIGLPSQRDEGQNNPSPSPVPPGMFREME